MNQADQDREELVRQWLNHAEEDLGLAEELLRDHSRYLSAIAFHAQQAAEKFLKALLVRHQKEFPKTHDLGEILDLVAAVNQPLADSLAKVMVLTPYSVGIRYPGEQPGLTRTKAEEAVALARQVAAAVAAAISHGPSNLGD